MQRMLFLKSQILKKKKKNDKKYKKGKKKKNIFINEVKNIIKKL